MSTFNTLQQQSERRVTFEQLSPGSEQENRYMHADEEMGASNEKDFEIAKLKLEAFELR